MLKSVGGFVAVLACLLSTLAVEPAAADSSLAPRPAAPETTPASSPPEGDPVELEAPVTVELESDLLDFDDPDFDDNEEDSGLEQQLREKAERRAQIQRLLNQKRRATAAEQAKALQSLDPTSPARARQNPAGLYASYANVVPAAAKGAVESAIATWSDKLRTSTGPIEVEVSWANLGKGVLASAGPATYVSHEVLPTGFFYPVSQANTLAQVDYNGPDRPEIHVELNSSVNWYTGTTGKPGSNQVDMTSVVLHEIAHGLGFLGSARTVNGTLTLAQPSYVFDRHVTHLATPLVSFPNPTAALTSNNLYIKSSATTTAELYAPSIWQPGTSYSHVRPVGSQATSLMTPSLSYGIAKRAIDQLTLNILTQTGWQLKANATTPAPTPTCVIATPASAFAAAVKANAVAAQVWRLYSAYYLRQPAASGFNYWRNARNGGSSHTQVSNYFASSVEFVNRYGTLTNSQFVDLVFNNVLCRNPTNQGRNYWIGRLQSGMPRGDLMLYFSEGQEYLNKTGTGFPLVS